jgi:hypothetical protein
MQLFNELKDHQDIPSDINWTLASEIFFKPSPNVAVKCAFGFRLYEKASVGYRKTHTRTPLQLTVQTLFLYC